VASDHGRVHLSKVSVRVSAAYVLGVSGMAIVAMLTPWDWGTFAANILTLPAGTLVLGLLYFFVVPVLDLGYGVSGDGSLGLTVVASGYVVAAVVNVVLVLGLVTLCRELRDSRRRARGRAASASQ
jgi:protein-S-isoprenylcysteine O-methyltransferase Ste14